MNKRQIKANRPEPLVKLIKTSSFNPVMKPGFEIISVSTVNQNHVGSHLVVATARRAV
jgi:hypothetical protein